VTIRAADRASSQRFYESVLPSIGHGRTYDGLDFVEWDDFSLMQASAELGPTRGLHLAFVAPSRAHVDAFWRAGIAAGYVDDGAPGPRPQYREDYYGGFLLDPDGNSVEAVHHGALRSDGLVDHLWLRVADLAEAQRFYEAVAPHAGFRLLGARPDRAGFGAGNGSFSIVTGTPTRNTHIAFPVSSDAAVDAFHRALVEAGYHDNGAPGERRHYHPGYYGAFVLAPDGTNVELVNHHRPTKLHE
jgi:catechol 2,3-dioxygenase-like lactoylglutathione lyase family enzyme